MSVRIYDALTKPVYSELTGEGSRAEAKASNIDYSLRAIFRMHCSLHF